MWQKGVGGLKAGATTSLEGAKHEMEEYEHARQISAMEKALTELDSTERGTP
jgi:hypothetical protein